MKQNQDWPSIDPDLQNTAMANTSGVTWWAVEDSNGNPVQIELAEKGKEYVCPECKGCMIPVKGEQRAHHFRHKSSTSSDGNGCGGEGPRHYRVKTMLAIMLRQIEREAMRWETKIELERRVGNDQPDILVSIGPQKLLGIEIVDSNPPSDEKKGRWGNQLHEVWISDWDDRTIGNALLLSGKLIPTITAFKAMTEEITTQISSHRRAVEAVQKYHEAELEELQSAHQRRISELQESLDSLYLDEELKVEREILRLKATRDLPALHVGTWRRLTSGEYGVTTSMDAKHGDHVLVVEKKGAISTVSVIQQIGEIPPYWPEKTAVFNTTARTPAPEIQKLIAKLAEEKAAAEKEEERRRRRNRPTNIE